MADPPPTASGLMRDPPPQQQQQQQQEVVLKVMRLSRPSLVHSTFPIYVEPLMTSAPSPAGGLLQAQQALEKLQEMDALVLGCSSSASQLPSSVDVVAPVMSQAEARDVKWTGVDLLTGGIDSLSLKAHSTDRRLPRMRDWSWGSMLSLPGSFGSIYLGETFSCYLCCAIKSSQQQQQQVSIQVELQTLTQRFDLTPVVSRNSAAAAAAGVLKDVENDHSLMKEWIVHQEMKELGVHVLVCTLNYTTTTTEPLGKKSLRKFYKFQVLSPLSVKTKLHQGGRTTSSAGMFFLEAQVQNETPAPLWMEKVHVTELAEGCRVSSLDLNTVGSSPESDEPLLPQCTRQYLFQLFSRPSSSSFSSAAIPFGKMDLHWRSTLGEQGHLQTSSLSFPISSNSSSNSSSTSIVTTAGYSIKIEPLDRIPSSVGVERPFDLRLRLNLQATSTRVVENENNVENPSGGGGGPSARRDASSSSAAVASKLEKLKGLRLIVEPNQKNGLWIMGCSTIEMMKPPFLSSNNADDADVTCRLFPSRPGLLRVEGRVEEVKRGGGGTEVIWSGVLCELFVCRQTEE